MDKIILAIAFVIAVLVLLATVYVISLVPLQPPLVTISQNGTLVLHKV